MQRLAREALRQLVQAGCVRGRAGSGHYRPGRRPAGAQPYNALLARRIRGGHATLELEREQFEVQQQIADVLKQQAEKRARAAGDPPVPDARLRAGRRRSRAHRRTLRKQLGRRRGVAGDVPGHEEDASLVARIRKVLADGGRRDLRGRAPMIQGLIDDLRQMQEKSSVDLTRFQTAARGQFVLAATAARGVVINGRRPLDGDPERRAQ